MSFHTDLKRVGCPYCGEPIDLVIDLSVELQTYIEDCAVCCRPISIEATVDDGDATVNVRHENE